MPNSYEEIWKANGADLRELIELLREVFTNAGLACQLDEITEYVEANEFSLALEAICADVFQYALPISEPAYRLMKQAGHRMSVDEEYWTRTHPQIV